MTTHPTSHTTVPRRTRAAGQLLFGMVVLSLVWGFFPVELVLVHWAAGFCAVIAAALLIADVSTAQRLQVGALLAIGLGLLAYGRYHGVAVSLPDVISRNTGLLTMIMSVGFLRLIVVDDRKAVTALPVGKKAYLQTLLGVGVFGSVINISAPIVVCDRLAMHAPIDLFTAGSVTRVFSACAAWSPYFAGTAVVLTYVSGVHLGQVMISGLPMLLLSIVIVYFTAMRFKAERVSRFHGYPITVSSIWIPAALTILVVLSRLLAPELSILVSISLSALLLTCSILILRHGWSDGINRFSGHINSGLPRTVNELLLFLAAGVLATGLSAWVSAGAIQLSLDGFTVQTAAILLAIMLLISAMGIHPVIQISGLTPLVLTANPDPDLLALTYLFAWSLGTCASPLSGTHLIFQGRFGIPAWRGATQNWKYVGVMYFVAVGLLQLQSIIF